ncbi:hypothetical protein [Bacillus sp. 3255]|uniref:hypothetical protein n=1 Tax=Bacillus sp. 3255 TaxID=2817904 RepID=UPI00285F26FE|nr:hypothetical protein [Bacillus sp. 3255]MDR6884318.1 hypothetical protein [Bacillus sp. 3255]
MGSCSRCGQEHDHDDEIEGHAKLFEQMNWMVEKLGLETVEELISKALSFLHMAIELEDRGYTIKAYKKLGLFEGAEHIEFKIRP